MQEQVIFGVHAITAALTLAPENVKRLIVLKKNINPRLQALVDQATQAQIPVVFEAEPALLKRQVHQGVMAELHAAASLNENDLYTVLDHCDHDPLLLILDGIQDPHNLGACLRTADAAGVDAVIIPKDRAVGLTPTVRKVAAGATESLLLIRVTNLARVLRELQHRGIWLYGTAEEAPQSVYDIQYQGPVALIMGAEEKGLRRLTREHCDQLIHLPMDGYVSSLNVSVATGICLYEIQRQRRFVKNKKG